jgi:hypothetical protein
VVKKEEPPPEPKKEEPPPPPPPPKKTAKEIVTGGSTFMFSLDDSADAKKMHGDECAKKSKKQDKIDACMKDVAATAAKEGIRFEKDDKGAWWYVSFGADAKGKEVVHNKIAFKITKEEDGKLTTAPEGKDAGKSPMKTLPKEVVVEVPDESTIAMSDPKKGRLVFKKKLSVPVRPSSSRERAGRTERKEPGRSTGLFRFHGLSPIPAGSRRLGARRTFRYACARQTTTSHRSRRQPSLLAGRVPLEAQTKNARSLDRAFRFHETGRVTSRGPRRDSRCGA